MFKAQLRRYGYEIWKDLKGRDFQDRPDREALSAALVRRSQANRAWEYRIVDKYDRVTDSFFGGVRTPLEPKPPEVFVPVRAKRR